MCVSGSRVGVYRTAAGPKPPRGPPPSQLLQRYISIYMMPILRMLSNSPIPFTLVHSSCALQFCHGPPSPCVFDLLVFVVMGRIVPIGDYRVLLGWDEWEEEGARMMRISVLVGVVHLALCRLVSSISPHFRWSHPPCLSYIPEVIADRGYSSSG